MSVLDKRLKDSKVNKLQLYKAHQDIEGIMEVKDKSRLSKSLDSLRERFKLGAPTTAAATEGGALLEKSSTLMPGNDGYPNDEGAESRISRARSKSKPAKHPDGNYEGLESGEDDTTSYENDEEDVLDGASRGKPVTSKSFAASTEEDFYKSVIDSDEDGEAVAAINATDALEHLTTVMGKSIAVVSKQSEAIGMYATTQFVELNKSMAVLAEAIGAIMETLEKSASAWALPIEENAPETGTEGATQLSTTATATAAEETTSTNKSQQGAASEVPLTEDQKKYQNTVNWLQKSSPTNIPSYFSVLNGQAGMQKSAAGTVDRTSPEELDTLAGKKRVRTAITTLIKSQGLNPDLLAMTDYKAPSEVVKYVPAQFREELKKLLA